MNVLLVIVDCLRLDRVSPQYMPWLHEFGKKNVSFSNYHSVSHCTDPSVTALLTGLHPDSPALRLYSMMYGTSYNLSGDVEMICQTAKKANYDTLFVSNLGRWYKRFVDVFIDCRGWAGAHIFSAAAMALETLEEPWLAVVHTDDCHTNYTGGSYDAACAFVDRRLKEFVEGVNMTETVIIITSDHGEGLGQSGPDNHEIKQHGYGLWDFLTHVPLIVAGPPEFNWSKHDDSLVCNLHVYDLMKQVLRNQSVEALSLYIQPYVFQAGATPEVFHRGVVDEHGRQFVRSVDEHGTIKRYWIGEFDLGEQEQMESALAEHCSRLGIDYGRMEGEQIVVERLKGLGYWEE